MTCDRCGAEMKTITLKDGTEDTYCGPCCLRSLKAYVDSGGETDEERAQIERYIAAMAAMEALAEAMRS